MEDISQSVHAETSAAEGLVNGVPILPDEQTTGLPTSGLIHAHLLRSVFRLPGIYGERVRVGRMGLLPALSFH